jgi:hypothetical protein
MTAQRQPSRSPSSRNLLGAAIIAVAAAIVYAPSMSGPFLLDDDLLLTQSRLIEAPDGLYRIWFTSEPVDFWPVANSSLWLEWRLWRYYTTGYKATNLALHIAGSLLLWAVLARLSIPGAWLAALAFAVHPVNVESVAWIAQRKNVLSLLFFVGSIYCFVRSDDTRSAAENAKGRPKLWYFLSLIAFLLAMLSKASVVTLPLVLAGIVLARRRISRKDILSLTPFFVVAGGLTLLNLWFRSHGQDIEIRQVDSLDRILGAAAAIWFYLGKAVAPVNLAFIYPQWNVNASDWVWWCPLLAAIGVTALFWFYRRTWAWPW